MNFFDTISDKREVAFRELDETKFVPAIRNHLVQLFRKAHACIWRSDTGRYEWNLYVL